MNEIKIITTQSILVEAIGIIADYGYERRFSYINEHLSDRTIEFFNKISLLNSKGWTLVELLRKQTDYNDLEEFKNRFPADKKAEFVFELLGSDIPTEEIYRVMNKTVTLESFFQSHTWIKAYDVSIFEYLFYQTEDFIEALMVSISEITALLAENVQNIEPHYAKGLKKVRTLLKSKVPLNAAMELMGKKFRRISDYNKYVFVPSYYFPINVARIFDMENLILVFNVNPELTVELSSEQLVNSLKAISDKTRLEIIKFIVHKPSFGKEIAKHVGVSTATVSHHIEILKASKLIYEERVKNTKYYSLNRTTYAKVINELNSSIFGDNKNRYFF